MKVIGVIPARYGSKRFPGKPLAQLAGKPVVQWVVERANKARRLDRVIVATDDVRIMRAVWHFGGEAMLTSRTARSGTDRVAEVCKKLSADVVINIQGDEPLISPKVIDRLVHVMLKDKRLLMATAAGPLRSESETRSENVVKVVLDRYENALYFTRAAVPHHLTRRGFRGALQHYGIYAYRTKFLLKFAKWKQTPLELAESLEQLRALEHGIRIRVVRIPKGSIGIDTKQDLEKAKRYL